MNIVIVGRGRVGTALARALRDAGIESQLLSGRRLSGRLVTNADVVILAVSDPAISQCAQQLVTWLSRDVSVLHCAGARGPDELAGCRTVGAHVGVIHPLVSFADPQCLPTLRGATFISAGDAPAIRAAKVVADALGAKMVVAPIHGPVYHALVAMIANGAVGLVNAAIPALARLGLGRRDAEHAIGALLKTVAENVESLGVPKALTGPMARGDAAAITAHRTALQQADPDAAGAYDAIAPLVLRCAVDAGLPTERAAEIRTTLSR
ncbi:MAG: DUF2520 domain-containing protein [Acidiferrobacterales bacterium]|nr:DUF2520 domain-containing protein [Acidiferrobacterales bacterium]